MISSTVSSTEDKLEFIPFTLYEFVLVVARPFTVADGVVSNEYAIYYAPSVTVMVMVAEP